MSDQETPEPRNIPPKLSVPPSDSKAGSEQETNAGKPEEKDEAAANAGKEKPEQPAVNGEEPTVILHKTPSGGDQKRKTSRISLDSALTSRIDEALGQRGGQTAPAAGADSGSKPMPGDSALTSRIDDALGEGGNQATSGDADRGGKPDAGGEDGGPKTIRLSRPPSAGPQGKPAAEETADQGAPKTIRLKRPSPASPSADAPDSKSKTSRISLDQVLQSGGQTDESAAGGATGIKTIRLRKPGQDTGTGLAATAASGGEAAATQEAKSRTSRLDVPESQDEAEDAVPSTQRKTIRIKRPDAAGGGRPGRTLTLARDKKAVAGTAAEQPQDGAEPEAAVAQERVGEPGALFAIATMAALIVAALLVYMLVSQAFPDAGLSWFGQLN